MSKEILSFGKKDPQVIRSILKSIVSEDLNISQIRARIPEVGRVRILRYVPSLVKMELIRSRRGKKRAKICSLTLKGIAFAFQEGAIDEAEATYAFQRYLRKRVQPFSPDENTSEMIKRALDLITRATLNSDKLSGELMRGLRRDASILSKKEYELIIEVGDNLNKIIEEAALRKAQLDPSFREEVTTFPGGQNIKRCYQCGTCSAGCPVREIDEKYNPRKIIRMVILGMRERVLSSDFIWLCSQCYTCEERCPQDVRIKEVMEVLKNMAVKKGYIHNSFAKQAETIGDMGVLYPLSDFENKRRIRLGLPKLPSQNLEVQEIYKITGLSRLLSKKGSV